MIPIAINPLGRGGEVIPSAYTRLNYLEASGTQWIDIPYYPGHNTHVTCCFGLRAFRDTFIFGGRESFGNKAFGLDIGPSNIIYAPYGQDTGLVTPYTDKFALNTDYIIDLSMDGFFVNGLIKKTYDVQKFISPCNFMLFSLRQKTGVYGTSGMIGYIRTLTIKEGGVRLFDFFPVLRNSDQEPGVYDTVSRSFFGNTGTGKFIFDKELS